MNWVPFAVAVLPLGLFLFWLWWITNGFGLEAQAKAREEGFGDE